MSSGCSKKLSFRLFSFDCTQGKDGKPFLSKVAASERILINRILKKMAIVITHSTMVSDVDHHQHADCL